MLAPLAVVFVPHLFRGRWVRLGVELAVVALALFGSDGVWDTSIMLGVAALSLCIASWRFGDSACRHDAEVGDEDGFGPSYRGRVQSVAVVVLGDAGRSPRMQYRTLSLARSGATLPACPTLSCSLLPAPAVRPDP